MGETERDTSRTVVKTYVPAYQRAEWDEHAEELDMSRSEFVRSMVQAGRRGFEGTQLPTQEDTSHEDHRQHEPETSTRAEGSGDTESLERAVIDALSPEEYRSWDELVEVVTDDVEQRLEQTLQELQADGTIRHSPRNGGYTRSGKP